jgi:acyl CoA:acetate/3-ketoacid CoA transferase
VPHLLLEQNRFHQVQFAIEQGSIGGLPLVEFGFGNSVNPLAIVDAASQFELFQGGCFSLAMLSFLQVDEAGRVNVHLLKARPHLSVGIGGFVDIAANARRIVFVGQFTAGGLELEVDHGRLRIVKEGKAAKFVKTLDAVSFDPQYARAEDILFVTERATLGFRGGALEVIEVAPGVDLERDVIGRMQFVPGVRRPL